MRQLALCLMLSALFLAVGLASSCSQQASTQADPNEPIFKSYDFPSRAGLTHLCQQHYTESRCNITFDVFVSQSSPSELTADYRGKLVNERYISTWRGGDERGIWRIRGGGAALYVLPVSIDRLNVGAALDLTCGQTLPSNSQSRIVLTKGMCWID